MRPNWLGTLPSVLLAALCSATYSDEPLTTYTFDSKVFQSGIPATFVKFVSLRLLIAPTY
jgi:hypothetical protein